jgi:hypothetical protein
MITKILTLPAVRTVLVRVAALVGGVSILAAAGACSSTGGDDASPHIVVTTNVLGDVVGELVGPAARVDVIAGERAAGRTVIESTHDMGDAATADHLLLLAGRVVATGPPADVLTDVNLAEAYGGHLLRFGSSTLILDDHPHH